LPRAVTIDKVLKCIKENFNKCELVTPWLIQERSKNWCRGYIDYREALAALESLAFDPGQPVAYDELQSCLTRSNKIRDFLLNKYPKEWWYDAEGCEVFPVFPRIHQIVAKNLPMVHSLLQHHSDQ
jgi:hypothetical protein